MRSSVDFAAVLAAYASPPPLQPTSEQEIKSFYAQEKNVGWRTDDGELAGYTTFRPDGTVTQSGVIGTGDPLWGKKTKKTTSRASGTTAPTPFSTTATASSSSTGSSKCIATIKMRALRQSG